MDLSYKPADLEPSTATTQSKKDTTKTLLAIAAVVIVVLVSVIILLVMKPAQIDTEKDPTPTPTATITPTPTQTTVVPTIISTGKAQTVDYLTVTLPEGWTIAQNENGFKLSLTDEATLWIFAPSFKGSYEVATQCEPVYNAIELTKTILRKDHFDCTKELVKWLQTEYVYPEIPSAEAFSIDFRATETYTASQEKFDALMKTVDDIVKSIEYNRTEYAKNELRSTIAGITWYADTAVGSGQADAIVFKRDGSYVFTTTEYENGVASFHAEVGTYAVTSSTTVELTSNKRMDKQRKVTAVKEKWTITFGSFIVGATRNGPDGEDDPRSEYFNWTKVAVKGKYLTYDMLYDFDYNETAISGLSDLTAEELNSLQ